MEGRPRIVPISSDEHFSIASRDPDPRGMPVIAADGAIAGTVADVWIDRSDRLIRSLEIDVDGVGNVLAPMAMTKVDRRRNRVVIDALATTQFAGAPKVAQAGQITRYEEERVVAYFGGGYLYATRDRAEPYL